MVVSAKEFNEKKRKEILLMLETEIIKIEQLLKKYPDEIGYDLVFLGELSIHKTLQEPIISRFKEKDWDLRFDGRNQIYIKLLDNRIPDLLEGNRG